MLWVSRLATATANSTSEVLSQTENIIPIRGEIEGLSPGNIGDSPADKTSARGYLDVVKLGGAQRERERERDWDRDPDGDGSAVVDAEILCIRALVDGVHIIYF